jgi:uncharacterized membrane protein YhaH (DUF805 family)
MNIGNPGGLRMNGEGVCYPAFLLGGLDAKPMAFNGPAALFISGRFRAPLGPMKEDTLVESSGRSWTLHAVTAIGRWGTWKEQLQLGWRRQYLVQFDATEGPAMTLGDLKTHMLQRADASEAALRADTEVDEQVRQYFLEAWAGARENLVAAETFQAVADAMGPCSLYPDNWFRGRGRSNRAEYLAVVLVATVMMVVAGLIAALIGPTLGAFVDFGLGFVVPFWLIAAAAARRSHDFGWPFYFVVILFLMVGAVELGAQKYLEHEVVLSILLGIAAYAVLILGLAIPPGTPGENRYDPQPNPGPSL